MLMKEVYHTTVSTCLPDICRDGMKTLRQQADERMFSLDSQVASLRSIGYDERLIPDRLDTLYFLLERPAKDDGWVSTMVDEEEVFVANNVLERLSVDQYNASKMTLAEYLKKSEGRTSELHPITGEPLDGEKVEITTDDGRVMALTYSPEVRIKKSVLLPDKIATVNVGSYKRDEVLRDMPLAFRAETIVVKTFADLGRNERSRLHQLTKENPSGFRDWLNDNDQSGKFAAILYLDDKIVGWAGASQGLGALQIGVYVDNQHRQQKLGTKALTRLMDYLTSFGEGRYIQYEFGFREFFQPILDKYDYGFHSEQQGVTFAEHRKFSSTS